jgi:ABC-type molybdate transport system ATPase subunit
VDSLVVRGLSVRLGERVILNGCNAEFPARRRTVLAGSSGAGKSTLLNAIAGLITPEAGTIELGAHVLFSSTEGIDIPPHKRHIGYVFQDLALWPHLTALDQVLLVGRSVGLSAKDAIALLESVGIAKLAHRRPGELSGGEQQRLAVVRAVASKPAILLLDEPFSSMDREMRKSLYELVRMVSAQVQGPTIYVTHNTEDVEVLAEHAVHLSQGKIAVD